MPVIGRLDKQVDALLIAPINSNSQPTAVGEAAAEQTASSSVEAQTASKAESTETRRDSGRGELPVWLL